MVYLQLGRVDEAIADYNAALAAQPDKPHSLYGRGLARLKKGDTAGGNADITRAKQVSPQIELEFANFKLR
jgi:tetratricopeptide (TPR) repeat protein